MGYSFHVYVVDFGSGVSIKIGQEGVRINDGFIEDNFVSFGFFHRF